ncbi:MAG: hypothetical protein QM756_07175 [Polyangiaceae bacterium]
MPHFRYEARRWFTRGALCAVLTVLPWVSAGLLGACGSDSTGGTRVTLHTELSLDESASAPFVTPLGWTVSLDRALISSGELHYYDGEPPLVFNAPSRHPASPLWDFVGLRLAHAHPGHYQAGNALGEMLEAASEDLSAGPVTLADGGGVSGTYRSGSFGFHAPPVGSVADALAGHVALASGVATKDGEEPRYFVAFADLSEVEQSAVGGNVEGCEFVSVDIQKSGTVHVLVDAKVWFNLVDFAELEPGSADAPGEFPVDSQPRIAFAQGLAQLSAYKFSYSAE